VLVVIGKYRHVLENATRSILQVLCLLDLIMNGRVDALAVQICAPRLLYAAVWSELQCTDQRASHTLKSLSSSNTHLDTERSDGCDGESEPEKNAR
jgi:hypothetical protein